jgi:predicted GH43/DUF377 family glycosyl hydrolase
MCLQTFLLSLGGFIWFSALCAPSRAEELIPSELVRFEAFESNPIFAGQGAGYWDLRIRERGWILREDDRYHMWFTGYDGSQSGVRMLGYATSPDGLNWLRHRNNPLNADTWIEDMTVIRRDDTYYMFAEGLRDRPYLFTSQDRVTWTRVGQLDVRVTSGEPIEEGPYGTPTVWLENDTWHYFYERRDLGIWLATSQDLKVWTNVQDEPVLTPGPNGYDEHLIAMNQVVKHQGHYYAYYHGSSKNRPGLWTTNVATSDDLIHWTKYSHNPLLPVEENKSSGILVHDGRRFRLYTMHPEVHVHFPSESATE